jgi:hypothetical protein
MIVPRLIENLFVVGRCASMTHLGQSAARVSGACFAMGEAAGTAASLALRANVTPRQLDRREIAQALRVQGALL